MPLLPKAVETKKPRPGRAFERGRAARSNARSRDTRAEREARVVITRSAPPRARGTRRARRGSAGDEGSRGCFGKTAEGTRTFPERISSAPHRRSQSPTRTSGCRASPLETRDAQTLPPSTEGFSTPAPPDPGGLLRIVDAIEYDSNPRETCPFYRSSQLESAERASPAQRPRQKLKLLTKNAVQVRSPFPVRNSRHRCERSKKSVCDIVCQNRLRNRCSKNERSRLHL